MIKRIIICFIVSMLSSCEYDYDISQNFDGEFTPQVVFNSMITPDSVITGSLFWTRHVDDTSTFKRVDAFSVELFEEDVLIYESDSFDGEIKTDIHPKAGMKYRVEIDVPDYGMVKATTNIPIASIFTSTFDRKVVAEYDDYYHYTIENITVPQKVRALWIKTIGFYDDNTKEDTYLSYYMNNTFCDQVNAAPNNFDISESGSNVVHYDFVRIPFKNVGFVSLMKFSTGKFYDKSGESIYLGEDEWGYPIWESVDILFERIALLVITPSDDYDKYSKAVFMQREFGDTSIPIFNDIINVHSNIENGVGIFAGYTADTHYYSDEELNGEDR